VSRVFDCTDPARRSTGVKAAVSAAGRGRVVLLPTESVYALLTDAFSAGGVSAVRGLKGRPPQSPLPVAVSSVAMLRGVAERLPPAGQALVEAFWPGPLTLVCRQQPSLAWSVAGVERALTVRMPLHPLALEVIAGVGPSVLIAAGLEPGAELDGVDVVLDGGPVIEPEGVSSVVDVRPDVPLLVRAGALDLARLQQVVPELREAEER
jgi:L-threonylcarbamoyladenylate synthase